MGVPADEEAALAEAERRTHPWWLKLDALRSWLPLKCPRCGGGEHSVERRVEVAVETVLERRCVCGNGGIAARATSVTVTACEETGILREDGEFDVHERAKSYPRFEGGRVEVLCAPCAGDGPMGWDYPRAVGNGSAARIARDVTRALCASCMYDFEVIDGANPVEIRA